MGFRNGVLCYKEEKTLLPCVKTLLKDLFVEASNYLTALTGFMQQFGMEVRKRDMSVGLC